MEIKIIINDGATRSKRYRATPEQIQRNEEEIRVQNERDERAREEANRISNTNPAQDNSPHHP
jgi:hypothetical protein